MRGARIHSGRTRIAITLSGMVMVACTGVPGPLVEQPGTTVAADAAPPGPRAAFGRLLSEHRAESAAIQQQVSDERQASQDRIAELRQESLGGVETYVDPVNQGLVQLPVGWNEYWSNPRGEYLTTDTPGFDPDQFDNQGWQRLQRWAP